MGKWMRELRNSSVEKKAVDIKTREEARRQRANGQDLLAAPRPYIPTHMPNPRLAGPYALQRVQGAYIKCHEKTSRARHSSGESQYSAASERLNPHLHLRAAPADQESRKKIRGHCPSCQSHAAQPYTSAPPPLPSQAHPQRHSNPAR